MPVKACFFNHKVVASMFKFILQSHDEHNYINHYTGKYMEAMKAGNGKKEVGEIRSGNTSIMIWERVSAPPCAFMK